METFSKLPQSVARYREEYRKQEISPRYRATLHALFNFGGGTAALIASLAQLESVRPLEWLALPLSFVYLNIAEYLAHRYPMHRPFRGLGLIYKRHACQHHRFFTHESMSLESARDIRAVLFKTPMLSFYFGLFAAPAWLLLAWLTTSNVAWLFVAASLAYFLNYELLHLAYHLPPSHALARSGLVKRLRWLHQSHHNPELMTRANFNVTYPLGDWLFGTLRRQRPAALTGSVTTVDRQGQAT